MRILWHSNGPWVGTGYGQQTALWTPLLKKLGHDVIISSFWGLEGAPIVWNGIMVLPGSQHRYGADALHTRYQREQCDVLITLMDIWVLDPELLKEISVVHWLPADTTPLSRADRGCLDRSGAIPMAMSRHGELVMQEAGYEPLYVPHAVDTTLFQPLPAAEREQVRAEMGLSDKFVIGINASNKDSVRKGMWEQFAAFAELHKRHPDTYLVVHGLLAEANALDLRPMIRELELADCVRFVDQYSYMMGSIRAGDLARWYNALDLYTNCAYGEGFGLTILEALACGVPVVVTDASSMPEVAGAAGWKVKGYPFWNPVHHACWAKPDIESIVRAYEQAYKRGPAYQQRQRKAREHALQYSAETVLRDYWVPALKSMRDRLGIAG